MARDFKLKLKPLGWLWFVGLALLLVAAMVSRACDNATELAPIHKANVAFCVTIAIAMAVLSSAVCFFNSSGPALSRILASVATFGGLSLVVTYILASALADLVEQGVDFPSGRIQTYQSRLPIDLAYRNTGKDVRFFILTTPFLATLEISKQDYAFMLADRRPGDTHTQPNEISSQGYFCAYVTMQKSGEAVRVLHAGHDVLPNGTVGICRKA